MAQNGAKIKFLTLFKQSVDGTFLIFFGKGYMQHKVENSLTSF